MNSKDMGCTGYSHNHGHLCIGKSADGELPDGEVTMQGSSLDIYGGGTCTPKSTEPLLYLVGQYHVWTLVPRPMFYGGDGDVGNFGLPKRCFLVVI